MAESSFMMALSLEVKSWPCLSLLLLTLTMPECEESAFCYHSKLHALLRETLQYYPQGPDLGKLSDSRVTKWHFRRGPDWEMSGGAGLRAQVRSDGVDLRTPVRSGSWQPCAISLQRGGHKAFEEQVDIQLLGPGFTV